MAAEVDGHKLIVPVPRRNILTSQMIPEVAGAGATPKLALGPRSRAAASAGELLGTSRCVAAIDMDCFYAQCEEIRNPDLRGKPVGVQQKMLVITSNYAARAFGIQKGDPLRVVKTKCPEITICNGEDLTFYGEVSQRVFDVASRWTSKVEKLGLDEVFLDLTDAVEEQLRAMESDAKSTAKIQACGAQYPEHDGFDGANADMEFNFRRDWSCLDAEGRCRVRLGLASKICQEIRTAILQEVGLTSSAGISVSKMLAKLVASWKKPAAQTVFLPLAQNLHQLLPDTLPIQKIPGIGFSATQRCHELNVATIGDFIVRCDNANSKDSLSLSTRFDEKAIGLMRCLCLGLDDSEVRPSGPPKSCSVEDSFWQAPLRTDAQVTSSLEALARKLIIKVRSDERRFGCRNIPTLAVSLRHAPGPGETEHVKRERRQMHLNSMLRIAMDPGQAALSLDGAARQAELCSADELKVKQIVERAFGLFRKIVPREPFALNILNLQVQFDEAVTPSQRKLSFAPRAPLTASQGTAAKLKEDGMQCMKHGLRTDAALARAPSSPSNPSKQSLGWSSKQDAALTRTPSSPSQPSKRRDEPAAKAADFFCTSRLSFIGSWKARFKRFMKELLAEKDATSAGAFCGGAGAVSQFSEELRALASSGEDVASERSFYFHLDVDCFFVGVAAGGVRLEPIVVASGRGDTSEVCSANYAARAYGICANMFLKEAKTRCPNLEVIPTSPELFERFTQTSRDIYKILLQATENIEPLSCDEMFLQFSVSNCDPQLALTRLAGRLREDILRVTGCPTSVGIGPSTVVARWATRRAKPPNGDGICYIAPEAAEQELELCPTSSLNGVGYSTANRLEALGALTCGQARRLATKDLQNAFGATLGLRIAAMVRGEDAKEMQFNVRRLLAGQPRTMQSEVNWGVRLSERSEASQMIEEICAHLASRLHEEGESGPALHATRLKLIVKQRKPGAPEPAKAGGHGLCDTWSKSVQLPGSGTGEASLLAAAAMRLFHSCAAPATQIRGIGVALSGLSVAKQTRDSPLMKWITRDPATRASSTSSSSLAEAQECCVDLSDESDESKKENLESIKVVPVTVEKGPEAQGCSKTVVGLQDPHESGAGGTDSWVAQVPLNTPGAEDSKKSEDTASLRHLASMGFEAAEAAKALQAHGNLERAIEWLLGQRCSNPGQTNATSPVSVIALRCQNFDNRVGQAGKSTSGRKRMAQTDLRGFVKQAKSSLDATDALGGPIVLD